MKKYTRHKVEPAHGTRSGYDWHRRNRNEQPCDECRNAESSYWRQQRIIRKEAINSKRRIKRVERKYVYQSTRSKARKLGVDYGYYTHQDVLDKYGTDCHLCNLPIDFDSPRQTGKLGWETGLQIDHVFPLARGGSDTLDNVRPAHGYCNNIKNATVDYMYKFSGNKELAS